MLQNRRRKASSAPERGASAFWPPPPGILRAEIELRSAISRDERMFHVKHSQAGTAARRGEGRSRAKSPSYAPSWQRKAPKSAQPPLPRPQQRSASTLVSISQYIATNVSRETFGAGPRDALRPGGPPGGPGVRGDPGGPGDPGPGGVRAPSGEVRGSGARSLLAYRAPPPPPKPPPPPPEKPPPKPPPLEKFPLAPDSAA